MSSSQMNLCKVLLNGLPNLLKIIFLYLLLFINSYESSGSISSPQQSSVHCPRFSYTQVYTRDLLDCRVCYICFGRRFWRLTCPGSTVFSSKHKVCVWKNSRKDDCPIVKEKLGISSTISRYLQLLSQQEILYRKQSQLYGNKMQ